MDKPSLKQCIREAFPDMTDADFDNHESDLYVKWRPGLERWLFKNYEFHRQVTAFISQLDGRMWFDIPFAHRRGE